MTAQQVVWDEAISFPSSIATNPPQHWVSVGERVKGSASTSRGRQYEWDQVQTGTYSPTLINQDGAFNPANTASPYAPNVLPRRPYRKRFQYPATQNILTVDQATCGSTQAAGQQVSVAVPVWFSWVAPWNIVAEVDAYTGPNTFQQVLSSAQAAPFTAFDMDGWSAKAGQWHSAQVWMRATAGGTSPQVRLAIAWRDPMGNVLGTVAVGSPVTLTANSRTWQQITISAQAPAGACGGTLQAQMVNSVAVTWECGAFQIEYAQNPTVWTKSGNWYGVINGWTDRWPQARDMNGTYVLAQPKVLDSFARLAALYPPPPFYGDVLALNPAFFFPLDDPSTATSFRDLTGNYNPAPVRQSPTGGGTVQGGQGIQSASSSGTILGAPGPVVSMTNPNTGTGNEKVCSWISLDAVGIVGPPTSGGWTRMVAFNAATSSNGGYVWFTTNAGWDAAGQLLLISAVNRLYVEVDGPGGTFSAYNPATGTYTDQNWHLVFLTLSTDSKTLTVYVDGVNVYSNTTATSQSPLQIYSDAIGADAQPQEGITFGYNGSVAHVAQWNTPLTPTQITTLYTSWRTAWSGDSSGTRYQRVLSWAGYKGATSIDNGNTSDMGPATDVNGNSTALSLLGNVVTTENGNHYVRASDGAIRFEQRSIRYNQLSPTYTFGNLTGSGELPFADVQWDFDLDHVANATQVTVNQSGQVFTAAVPASAAEYDTLTLQRTINVVNPQEAVDAANYLANRYNQPQLRCANLTLNPARYSPDGGVTFPLWPVCGSMEISTRIRINDRPLGQPPIQFDGFVENIAWTVDPSTGDHLLVLQCSPADLNAYWVFSALHTTSTAIMNSGTNSITVNPLPDGAVNPFSCSVCNGQQFTLDIGTASAETLTVQSVSGGAPLLPNAVFANGTTGWTGSHSATLTATTATVQQTNVPTTVANVVATQNTLTSGLQMSAAATTGFSAGVNYRFECWLYSAIATTFTTNVNWNNSSGTFLSTTTAAVFVPANTWTKLVTTHLSPATAAQALAYVLTSAPIAIGVSFQITGICVCVLPVVTFTANAVNTHASGAVVCEATLPAGTTTPQNWDTSSLMGITTTLAY